MRGDFSSEQNRTLLSQGGQGPGREAIKAQRVKEKAVDTGRLASSRIRGCEFSKPAAGLVPSGCCLAGLLRRLTPVSPGPGLTLQVMPGCLQLQGLCSGLSASR